MIAPVLPTYARADIAFERGDGPYLFDAKGERYLDFGAGIAVNALGHAHPHLVAALRAQAEKLWHTSNLYRVPEQERLASRLIDATFADTVFFANSGAEAVECALKIARKYHHANGATERWRFITFEGAFHGRTLAMIAAGGSAKYLEGFGPKVDGFDQVPFDDFEAREKRLQPSHRRDPDRTHPGRNGRTRAARRLSQAAPPVLRCQGHPADLRRSANWHGAHGKTFRS